MTTKWRLPQALLAGLFLTLAGSPAQAQRSFGSAVAVGDAAVFVAEPGNVIRSGIVYVYAPDGPAGSWAEAARLTAPDAEAGDGFGRAVAASGNVLLASRPDEADGRGAVYAFERDGDDWRRTARLAAGELSAGGGFGATLALDGDRALVAERGDSTSAGAVHVLRREADGGWAHEATLTAADASPDDAFGAALALDGDRALVGAPRQADDRGAAYIFRRDASGEWRQAGKAVARTVSAGDRLGTSVAFMDDYAAVAAPRRDGAVGAVYLFEEDPESGEWAAYTRLLPYLGNSRTQFGATVAAVDDELWVGAPGANGFAGAIHRLRRDEDAERWPGARELAADEAEGGDAFAATLATHAVAGLAVAGSPGDDHGAGTAYILTRGPDGWMVADKVWSEPESFAAVTGGRVDCSDGRAAAWDCREVDLLAFLPVQDLGGERGIRMSDIWGWADPETGREYALTGLMNATAFVDVTDPENPVFLGELPMTEGARARSWRDIKVYDDHAFIVADGAGEHGVQVFDLTQLRDADRDDGPVTFEETARYDGVHSVHNIVINPERGYAYVVGASGGGNTCGGGLHIVDVRAPANPTFAGCFSDRQTGRAGTGYTHDAQCATYSGPDERYGGREICFGANETALSIADVTDPDSTVAIARASYPNAGYTHQGWLTDDHRHLYMNDELDEIQGSVERTRTLIWDVAELEDPQLVGQFMGANRATDHNLYIIDDLMYQSNYVSGLRVIDIEDRLSPREVGHFDTVPYGDNSPGFGGSWSNYPFLPSGIILVNSGREGLFILKVREPVT